MSDPSDAVAQVLARVAADTRRTVAYYGNVRGLPGRSRRPRRLLSETGFPAERTFSYVVPAPAHVRAHDPPRTVTSVTLHPYGLADDLRRLTSSRAADRRVRTAGTNTGTGVAPLATDATFLVAGNVLPDTSAPAKTASLIEAVVTARRGPAYHFVVTRRGDIIVAAVLDDETAASRSNAATTIDVALEGAFAIRRTDHEARRFDGTLYELPYTPTQMLTLSVLIVKLRTVYPAVPTTLGTGLVNDYRVADYRGAPALNFSNGAWRNGGSPFDHALSDVPAFVTNLGTIPPFDLATQVFQPDQAPTPVATRTVAQTAIGQADTVGEQSVLLANYAALAGPERANAMQSAPRVRFFVERLNMAVRDAHGASNSAADTAEGGRVDPLTPATNVDPHVYDFTTGRWGDGEPF